MGDEPRVLGKKSKSITVRSVKGLTTFFEFGHTNSDYRSFLIARDAYQQSKKMRWSGYLESAAQRHFLDFITPYLTQQEISLAEEDAIKLTRDNGLEIECAQVSIAPKGALPQDDSDRFSYHPKIKFQATQRGLSADGYLVRDGSDELLILHDMLRLIPPSNGIIRPKLDVPNNEVENIQVASIAQIRCVIRGLETIYDHIKGGRLEELQSLKSGIKDTNGIAQEVLKIEYQKRLEMLLPKHVI